MLITINPLGRLGNQIFQYMFACLVADQFLGSSLVNVNLEKIGIYTPKIEIDINWKVLNISEKNQYSYLEDIAKTDPDLVIVNFYAQDIRLYEGMREQFSKKIIINFSSNENITKDELLIHLRFGDTMSGFHPDYWPQPLQWYDHIIRKTGLKPVFLGETSGQECILTEIRQRFPDCRILEPGTPEQDFAIFYNAPNVVLAVSSFSWLATWLSNQADKIYMPVCGLFSPHRNPERCFLPCNDPRYEFHILPDINRRDNKDRYRFCLSNDFVAHPLSDNVILWADLKMNDSICKPKNSPFGINSIRHWLKRKIYRLIQ